VASRRGDKLRRAGFVYEKAKQTQLMAQITETPQDEPTKVESWRLHVLLGAGFPLPVAERIAHSEADLHRAVALVRSGCDHETAARILV
jgi:hypothetical protein